MATKKKQQTQSNLNGHHEHKKEDELFIELENGRKINLLDFADGRMRILVVEESLPPEERAENMDSRMYITRFGISAEVAHTLLIKAVAFSRDQEMQERQQLQEAKE